MVEEEAISTAGLEEDQAREYECRPRWNTTLLRLQGAAEGRIGCCSCELPSRCLSYRWLARLLEGADGLALT